MVQWNSGEALSREAAMMRAVAKEVGQMQELGLVELRARYQQAYGEEARSKNLPYGTNCTRTSTGLFSAMIRPGSMPSPVGPSTPG